MSNIHYRDMSIIKAVFSRGLMCYEIPERDDVTMDILSTMHLVWVFTEIFFIYVTRTEFFSEIIRSCQVF